MFKISGILVGFSLLFAQNSSDGVHHLNLAQADHQHTKLCSGFVEENTMQIPVGTLHKSLVNIPFAGGLTQDQYNQVLDRVSALYTPIFQQKGGVLKINRLWTNSTVNASAERNGGTWNINMYGGLARHPAITMDGFALVACHEMGHHIGGAPKYRSFLSWASNEGQSDYFANLKCLREYFTQDNNVEVVAGLQVDSFARSSCEAQFSNPEEAAICMRGSVAGTSVSYLFQELRGETTAPKFDSPDTSVVRSTNDNHPATQCRMDTYFAGSLCTVSKNVDVDDRDPAVGSCYPSGIGARSFCWFKPN